MDVARFLEELRSWAASRPDVVGVAVVGSYARAAARPDSDVDLVILCTAPPTLLRGDWISRFGAHDSVALEDYGPLKALRVFYSSGLEVEFGVTDPAWASLPLDPGTRGVLAAGSKVLYDPQQLLRAAQDAAPEAILLPGSR